MPLDLSRSRVTGGFLSEVARDASSQPFSTIVSSTSCHRRSAAAGVTRGSSPFGERISPAMTAPSSAVRLLAGLPKYVLDAASMPYAPRPK